MVRRVFAKAANYNGFLTDTGWPVDTILDIATDGISGITSRHITLSRMSEPSEPIYKAEIKGTGLDIGFWVNPRRRYFSLSEVDSRRCDGTTGRRAFANAAIVGMVTGLSAMEFYAGDIIGSAVWPKAGAVMDKADIHKDQILEALEERLSLASSQLSPSGIARLQKLCALEHRQDLYRIATMSQRLVVSEDMHFKSFGTLPIRRIDEDLFPENLKARGFATTDMTIGQYLLFGLEYSATLRFRNNWSMTRAEDYCQVPIRARAVEILSARGSVTQPTPRAVRSSTPADQTARPQ